MDDDFNPDDLRPVPYRPDTELMLGPWVLGGIFFAFVLLCGLCFLVGYSIGRRSTHTPTTNGQTQGTQGSQSVAGSGSKPSAAPQAGNRARPAADGQSSSDATGTAGSDSASPAVGSSAQPVVKPALPDSAATPSLMVQIAAVSHQEDADVLVSALRKRGYAVTMRRYPADNLIHVQIGPFTSRNDADAARQKLLNDGYNAIVQP